MVPKQLGLSDIIFHIRILYGVYTVLCLYFLTCTQHIDGWKESLPLTQMTHRMILHIIEFQILHVVQNELKGEY